MAKKEKMKFSIHSINAKIIMIVLSCVLMFFILNIVYIIPQSKNAVQKATEKNMQDIATLSSVIVNDLIDDYGEDGVTYDVLKTVLDGRGLAGIDSSYVYVVNSEGTFLYHKKEEKVGTQVFNDDVLALLADIPTGNYQESGIFHYVDENGVTKYASYQVIDSVKWVTVIVANETEIMAEIDSVRNISIVLSTILGLSIIIAGAVAAKRITKPIRILTSVIRQTGNLDFSNNGSLDEIEKNKDETGTMARAVDEMEQNLRDLVGRISDTSKNLEEHAEKLADITSQIDAANTDNSATSQQLAASMQETSASMDMISNNTRTIKENADSIAESTLSSSDQTKEISTKAAAIHQETKAASKKTQQIYEAINA